MDQGTGGNEQQVLINEPLLWVLRSLTLTVVGLARHDV